jgi:hypothetical protein
MITSDNLDSLTSALVNARSKIPNFKKEKQGYGYKYVELSVILDGIIIPLSKEGLAVIQACSTLSNEAEFPVPNQKGVKITTRLQHVSGQYIESDLWVPISNMKGSNLAQEMGAAITYGRRYALTSLLCLATEEDVDASIENHKRVQSTVAKKTSYPLYKTNPPVQDKDSINVKIAEELTTKLNAAESFKEIEELSKRIPPHFPEDLINGLRETARKRLAFLKDDSKSENPHEK